MLHGSWIWDPENKNLTYIKPEGQSESASEGKNEVTASKTVEEGTSWQPDKERRQREGSLIVTADIKDVVVDIIKRERQLPKGFCRFVSLPLVDDIILWTLRYFSYYFDIRSRKLFVAGIESVPNLLGREYTLPEIQILTNVSLRCLGQIYCDLILGVDSIKFHHLKGGKAYLSCTVVDRELYEVFYKFLTDVIWVAFGKKEHDVIQYEVNRLFRSDEFNPFKPPPLTTREPKGSEKKQYRRSPLLEAVLSSLGTDPISGKFKQSSHAVSSKYDQSNQLPSSFEELKKYIEQELEYVGILGKNRDEYDSDLELISD